MSEKDGVRAMENSTAPGAIPLRVRNIAPHTGDQLVGYIPFGLAAVVAENEEGKTRILEAVTAIPLDAAKPEDLVTITRGQTEALVGFGTAELRLELRRVGDKIKPRATRQRSSEQGPIHDLPDPITLMITGGDFKSPESNWRERLKAINRFFPLEVTEEMLAELAGALPKPDDDIAAELSNRHSASPFSSLLAAADALADGRHGILHARKREARETANALGSDLERQLGRLEEIVARAKRDCGGGLADPELRRILADASPEVAALPAQLRRLEDAQIRLAAKVAERGRIRGERDEIRAGLGERPDAGALQRRAQAAARQLQDSEEVLAGIREKLAAAQATYAALQPQVAQVRGNFRGRWIKLQAAYERFYQIAIAADGMDGANPPWPGLDAEELLAQMAQGTDELRVALASCRELERRDDEASGKLGDQEAHFEREEGKLSPLRATLADAESALQNGLAAGSAWDRAAESLRGALPDLFQPGDLALWEGHFEGVCQLPEDGLDSMAVAVVAALRPRAIAAAAGPAFRLADEERQRIQEEQVAALDRAERLEADANATWDRLGDLISGAMASKVIRVGKGRTIEILLDDGRWEDVSSQVEISKGRLRRAMLDFYLERVPAGERNVRIDDEVMLPIGLEGRCEISQRAAAKQIRLMFEQPRLSPDDPREIRVIWYGAGPEIPAVEEVAQ